MKNYVNPLVVEVNMPQDKSKSPLPADDPRSNMFSMMGSQTPFEEKDIEKLKGIKNVKSVEEGFNLISLGTNSVTYNDKKAAVMAVATISSNITSSNIKKGSLLLVSAIMILVVLYISVVERTKEIGVLKTIGARRKDIKRIFVSEAFLIGLFSGVIALGISSIIMMAANTVSNKAFGINVVNITPAYALFGVGASIIISMIAGIMPASKAAKLDPVESLRRETCSYKATIIAFFLYYYIYLRKIT